jgi:hypothetical protein
VVRYSLKDLAALSHRIHLSVHIPACRALNIPNEWIVQFYLPPIAGGQRLSTGDGYLYRRQQLGRELSLLANRIRLEEFPELAKALHRSSKTRRGEQTLDCVAALLAQAAETGEDS